MKKINKKGFTIVELVIVIAVIAILAAVLIPTFATVIKKANENAAMQNARNEWTAFLAADKDNVVAAYDAVIKVGENYWFAVEDGSFETTVYATEADAIASLTITANYTKATTAASFDGKNTAVEIYVYEAPQTSNP